jgi:hypothetical protein
VKLNSIKIKIKKNKKNRPIFPLEVLLKLKLKNGVNSKYEVTLLTS